MKERSRTKPCPAAGRWLADAPGQADAVLPSWGRERDRRELSIGLSMGCRGLPWVDGGAARSFHSE